jgi:hypothetical protein
MGAGSRSPSPAFTVPVSTSAWARSVAVEMPTSDQGGRDHQPSLRHRRIHFEFFGHDKDTDRDGVPDPVDDCPDTPYGASVNSEGTQTRTPTSSGIDLCLPPGPRGGGLAGCPLIPTMTEW